MAPNIADTQTYSLYDHAFAGAIRSVSHVVGIKKLSQPFWNRWRASEVEDRYLFEFLNSIRSFDDWPDAALRLVAGETARLAADRAHLGTEQVVGRLRRLSYLCNLGQWGILPVGDAKRTSYLCCRDSYLEAERLAFGERFQRFEVPHQGRSYAANVHLPDRPPGTAPVVIIVHGIDACKEEHLVSELALVEAGFVAVGFDGPGQAEAFLIGGHLWDPGFPTVIQSVLDEVGRRGFGETGRTGLFGISFGAMWCYQAAAADPRIQALYDLGAPTNPVNFSRVPFLLKSMICRITGARTDAEIAALVAHNRIADERLMAQIKAPVRIVHGDRDRVVPRSDKEHLMALLQACGNPDVSFLSFKDGDHCATNHISEIRRDFARFFGSRLRV